MIAAGRAQEGREAARRGDFAAAVDLAVWVQAGRGLMRAARPLARFFPASWRRIVPDGGGPAQDRFEGPRTREVLSLLRDLLADSGRCLPLDELKAKLSGRNVTEQVRAPRAVPAAAWRGGLGVCRTPGLVLVNLGVGSTPGVQSRGGMGLIPAA